MEEWKIINECEKYEISNNGNIRNKKTNKCLKLEDDKSGYKRIKLCKKHFLVHRLVALAFIDNPENKPQIDHIDRNKQNNNIENLRWCLRSENNINREMKKGITNEKYIQMRNSKYQVSIRNTQNNFIKSFKTLEEAIKARDDILLNKLI